MHGEELLLFKNSETTKSQEVGKTLVILVMNSVRGAINSITLTKGKK